MKGGTHIAAFVFLGGILVAALTYVGAENDYIACQRLKGPCWSDAPEFGSAVERVVVAVLALLVFTVIVNGVFWMLRSRTPRA